MYRTLPYLALFAATVLLQVFLFDNLSISVYLNPLVYIAFIVLLFAFSSIVANYVYAENNLVFLRLDTPRYIWALRIITVLMVLLGTMISLPVIWQSADIIMALMAMTNLTAILLLSPTVRLIASDYLRQRRLGIQPTFDATRYPDIDQQLAPGAWNELPRE